MLKLLFPCIAVLGLVLLVRSVRWITRVFGAEQQEFAATLPHTGLVFSKPGAYEIDVKRRSIVGIITFRSGFELQGPQGERIRATASSNIFAGRKTINGQRMVPVAYFSISQPGSYTFYNLQPEGYKTDDRLVVMPRTGWAGVLSILATIGSAFLFIGGTILALLAFKGQI